MGMMNKISRLIRDLWCVFVEMCDEYDGTAARVRRDEERRGRVYEERRQLRNIRAMNDERRVVLRGRERVVVEINGRKYVVWEKDLTDADH